MPLSDTLKCYALRPRNLAFKFRLNDDVPRSVNLIALRLNSRPTGPQVASDLRRHELGTSADTLAELHAFLVRTDSIFLSVSSDSS